MSILENYITQNPSSVSSDGCKLSVVGKQIKTIGKFTTNIPKSVKVLYISNNSISLLSGIEQFHNIRSISCANNDIRFLGDLRCLTSCRYLEKVSFIGNVVASMPYYREYLISLCPNIISIDGINVLWKEKLDAKSTSMKAQLFYDQLRLNDLRNCILRHLQKLSLCHHEIKIVVIGKFKSLLGNHVPSSSSSFSSYSTTSNNSSSSSSGSNKYNLRDSNQSSLWSHIIGCNQFEMIIRITLFGGTFRWLQIGCAEDFDRSIQNLAYHVHISKIKKMTSAQKSQLSVSYTELSKHWDNILYECLQRQHRLSFTILNSFQVLSIENATNHQLQSNVTQLRRSYDFLRKSYEDIQAFTHNKIHSIDDPSISGYGYPMDYLNRSHLQVQGTELISYLNRIFFLSSNTHIPQSTISTYLTTSNSGRNNGHDGSIDKFASDKSKIKGEGYNEVIDEEDDMRVYDNTYCGVGTNCYQSNHHHQHLPSNTNSNTNTNTAHEGIGSSSSTSTSANTTNKKRSKPISKMGDNTPKSYTSQYESRKEHGMSSSSSSSLSSSSKNKSSTNLSSNKNYSYNQHSGNTVDLNKSIQSEDIQDRYQVLLQQMKPTIINDMKENIKQYNNIIGNRDDTDSQYIYDSNIDTNFYIPNRNQPFTQPRSGVMKQSLSTKLPPQQLEPIDIEDMSIPIRTRTQSPPRTRSNSIKQDTLITTNISSDSSTNSNNTTTTTNATSDTSGLYRNNKDRDLENDDDENDDDDNIQDTYTRSRLSIISSNEHYDNRNISFSTPSSPMKLLNATKIHKIKEFIDKTLYTSSSLNESLSSVDITTSTTAATATTIESSDNDDTNATNTTIYSRKLSQLRSLMSLNDIEHMFTLTEIDYFQNIDVTNNPMYATFLNTDLTSNNHTLDHTYEFINPNDIKTMKEMKLQVDQAITYLLYQQNNESPYWKNNQELRTHIQKLRKQMISNVYICEDKREELDREVGEERRVNKEAMQWMIDIAPIIQEIEDDQTILKNNENRLIMLTQMQQSMQDDINHIQHDILETTSLLEQVQEAHQSLKDQITHTPSLHNYVRYQQATTLLQHAYKPYIELINTDIVRRIMVQWRKIVQENIRIKQYFNIYHIKRNKQLIMSSLIQWKKMFIIQLKYEKIIHWKSNKTLNDCISNWLMLYRSDLLIQKYYRFKYMRARRQYFKFWRKLISLRKSKSEYHYTYQQKQGILKLLKRRIFNTIRAYSRRTIQISGIEESRKSMKASHFHLHKLFTSWVKYTTNIHMELKTKFTQIVQFRYTKIQHTIFIKWVKMLVVQKWYRIRNCTKVFLKLRENITRRNMIESNDLRGVHYMVQFTLHTGLHTWYTYYTYNRNLYLATQRLKSRLYMKLIVTVWLKWLQMYRLHLLFEKSSNKAIDHYLTRLMIRTFYSWKNVVKHKDIYLIGDSLWDDEEIEYDDIDANNLDNDDINTIENPDDFVVQEDNEVTKSVDINIKDVQKRPQQSQQEPSIDKKITHKDILLSKEQQEQVQVQGQVRQSKHLKTSSKFDTLRLQLISFNEHIVDDVIDDKITKYSHLYYYIKRWRRNNHKYRFFFNTYMIISQRYQYNIKRIYYQKIRSMYMYNIYMRRKKMSQQLLLLKELNSEDGQERIQREKILQDNVIQEYQQLSQQQAELLTQIQESQHQSTRNTLKIQEVLSMNDALFKDKVKLEEQIEYIQNQIKLIYLEAENMKMSKLGSITIDTTTTSAVDKNTGNSTSSSPSDVLSLVDILDSMSISSTPSISSSSNIHNNPINSTNNINKIQQYKQQKSILLHDIQQTYQNAVQIQNIILQRDQEMTLQIEQYSNKKQEFIQKLKEYNTQIQQIIEKKESLRVEIEHMSQKLMLSLQEYENRKQQYEKDENRLIQEYTLYNEQLESFTKEEVELQHILEELKKDIIQIQTQDRLKKDPPQLAQLEVNVMDIYATTISKHNIAHTQTEDNINHNKMQQIHETMPSVTANNLNYSDIHVDMSDILITHNLISNNKNTSTYKPTDTNITTMSISSPLVTSRKSGKDVDKELQDISSKIRKRLNEKPV